MSTGDGREGGKGWRAWMPTWKWTTATITGVGAIGYAWADAGHWTQGLTKALIALAVQRSVAYATPNSYGKA